MNYIVIWCLYVISYLFQEQREQCFFLTHLEISLALSYINSWFGTAYWVIANTNDNGEWCAYKWWLQFSKSSYKFFHIGSFATLLFCLTSIHKFVVEKFIVIIIYILKWNGPIDKLTVSLIFWQNINEAEIFAFYWSIINCILLTYF